MNRGAWGACNTPVNLQPQTLTTCKCYDSASQILGLGAVPPAGPFRARLGGPARGSSPTPPPRPCCRLRARGRVRAPSRHHAGSPPVRGRSLPAPTRAPPVLLSSACPAPAPCPQPPPGPPPGTPCVRLAAGLSPAATRPPLFFLSQGENLVPGSGAGAYVHPGRASVRPWSLVYQLVYRQIGHALRKLPKPEGCGLIIASYVRGQAT